jgi:hypothetical protein
MGKTHTLSEKGVVLNHARANCFELVAIFASHNCQFSQMYQEENSVHFEVAEDHLAIHWKIVFGDGN